jgi:hypothetical protein
MNAILWRSKQRGIIDLSRKAYSRLQNVRRFTPELKIGLLQHRSIHQLHYDIRMPYSISIHYYLLLLLTQCGNEYPLLFGEY